MSPTAFFPRRENIDLMEDRIAPWLLPAAERKALVEYMLCCWHEARSEEWRRPVIQPRWIWWAIAGRLGPAPLKRHLQQRVATDYVAQKQAVSFLAYRLDPESPHYFRRRPPEPVTALGQQIKAEIDARTDWAQIGGTPQMPGFAPVSQVRPRREHPFLGA